MNRKFNFCVGEFYHIYNRRNEKNTLFLDDSDYQRFIVLLYLCNSKLHINLSEFPEECNFFDLNRGDSIVDIGAYCLMPNHFHLLIREKIDNGISLFMQKLSTAYSMYFNKKHFRTGSLFESRFKASHVSDDRHLNHLFAYIHLNPIKLIDKNWKETGISNKEEAKKFLDTYQYSSYLDYIGKNNKENHILEISAFPNYFSTFKDFQNFIDKYIF